MEPSVRTYGTRPYRVAVLHGGPGAPGGMRPVAERLASDGYGVLEPLQCATSVRGQIQEFVDLVVPEADDPLTLVGHSWGAMLAYMVAATQPDLVAKAVLVAGGAFEASYAEGLLPERLSRLAPDERDEAVRVLEAAERGADPDALARLGELFAGTDAFDPMPIPDADLPEQAHVYRAVWPEMERLRASGDLIAMARDIRCAVVAIHGDDDPHPAAGVTEPLSRALDDFRMVNLDRCGHTPWAERQAAERFFEVLRDEVSA